MTNESAARHTQPGDLRVGKTRYGNPYRPEHI
jgi:hypothetical protein